MTGSPDVDAVELVSVRSSGDGEQLKIRVRDRDGRIQSVAMPANWLNDLVNAVPLPVTQPAAHALASWRMEAGADGTLLLTLQTPEGRSFLFSVKTWQAQGIASLATHGRFARQERSSLH